MGNSSFMSKKTYIFYYTDFNTVKRQLNKLITNIFNHDENSEPMLIIIILSYTFL